MSVLLSVLFMVCGGFAVGAICASLRHGAPLVRELRRQLGAPDEARKIRFTLLEHAMVRLQANLGPLRHRGRRKPVKHRLQGRKPRRAAA